MFQLGSGPKRRCCLLQYFPICGKKKKLNSSIQSQDGVPEPRPSMLVTKQRGNAFPFSYNVFPSKATPWHCVLPSPLPCKITLLLSAPRCGDILTRHRQWSGSLQWNKADVWHWVLFETLCSGVGAPSIPPHRCQGWPGSPDHLQCPSPACSQVSGPSCEQPYPLPSYHRRL